MSFLLDAVVINLQRRLQFILIHSSSTLWNIGHVIGHSWVYHVLSWIVALIDMGRLVVLLTEIRRVHISIAVLMAIQGGFNDLMALPTYSLIVLNCFICLLVHLLRSIHIGLITSIVNLTVHWLVVVLH